MQYPQNIHRWQFELVQPLWPLRQIVSINVFFTLAQANSFN